MNCLRFPARRRRFRAELTVIGSLMSRPRVRAKLKKKARRVRVLGHAVETNIETDPS
jgi:hypothetical protein